VEPLATGDRRRTNVDPAGLQTVTHIGTNGVTTTMPPDGTVTTLTASADPRFGMQAPVASTEITTPGGLVLDQSFSRTVTLSDSNDPLSLLSQTDTLVLNGRTATSTFDAATRTFTSSSAGGRQTVTTVDAQGRVVQTQVSGWRQAVRAAISRRYGDDFGVAA
jgi:hypothetical protein